MILLERLKSWTLLNGSRERPVEWRKTASMVNSVLKKRWILLVFLLQFIVPISVLKTLSDDGIEIFASQNDALLLEVFARTDLEQEAYPLLEESLRALPGVKEVVAVSPQESLRKVAGDPKLGIDTGWLMKKTRDLKDKETILPWSYKLHLARWDEKNLKTVIQKIEDLQVGRNKVKSISEIHYDRERWSLAFALYNYVRWITRISAFLLVISLLVPIFLAVKIRHKIRSHPVFLHDGIGFLALGLAGGLLSHAVQLAVLSFSFFPESFSWSDQLGRGLLFQISLSLLLTFSCFGVWVLGKTT